MKKLRFYFDTSILNFALAEDVPKEKEVTLKLLEEVNLGIYQAHISEVVLGEIERAPEEKAKVLLELIRKYPLENLSVTEEIRNLARRYIQEGIIPQKYEDDALHIACASVNDLDAIISWNFEHIVKLKTKREVVGINVLLGYKEIDIYSPWEVVGSD
jgi:predicted nucleic acid-binding protein